MGTLFSGMFTFLVGALGLFCYFAVVYKVAERLFPGFVSDIKDEAGLPGAGLKVCLAIIVGGGFPLLIFVAVLICYLAGVSILETVEFYTLEAKH